VHVLLPSAAEAPAAAASVGYVPTARLQPSPHPNCSWLVAAFSAIVIAEW